MLRRPASAGLCNSVTKVGKLIFFLILVVLAYGFIRSAARASRGGDLPRRRPAEEPAEAMKACARCGLHLPLSEAIEADGRFFCSQEHRRLGAK